MVKAILAWLFVFQSIDFKTAKYLTGLEYCTGGIRTREDIVFFDKALINDFLSVILAMIIINVIRKCEILAGKTYIIFKITLSWFSDWYEFAKTSSI